MKEDNSVLMPSPEVLVTNHRSVRTRLFKSGAVSVLLFPLAVALASAQTRQEKTFDTTATPHIGLSNLMGHVVVKGWDRQQVHLIYGTTSVQVSVGFDQLPLRGAAEKLHFITLVSSSPTAGMDKTVFYTFDVPMGSSVEIRNNEGGVEIEKLQGDVAVDSSGGNISVGDVAGRVVANSIDGNIEILRPAGPVEATTICGNVRLVGATGSALRAQTTSGKIVYEGDLVSGGDYNFRDYSGDIDMFLPPSSSFELNKTAVRGKFFSDIPAARRAQRSPAFRGAHTFVGSNVTSTATVQLSSYSGNVHIHRQP